MADSPIGRVQASHAALQAAECDDRQRRARGGLSPREAADCRAYIAGLRQRSFGVCADLAKRSSDWILSNTPCTPRVPTPGRPATIDPDTDQTSRRQSAILNPRRDSGMSAAAENAGPPDWIRR